MPSEKVLPKSSNERIGNKQGEGEPSKKLTKNAPKRQVRKSTQLKGSMRPVMKSVRSI